MPFVQDDLVRTVIGCAIEVHRNLGPGLLESAYQQCLAHELMLRRIAFATQVRLPLSYKGLELASSYRLDFLVPLRESQDGRMRESHAFPWGACPAHRFAHAA